MIRRNWMIGALGAALLPFAALAQSGDAPDFAPGGFHMGMHGPEAALLSGVNLSSVQQTQVQQLRDAARTQAKPLMQQLRSLHEQIDGLLFAAGAVDTTKLTALRTQEATLRGQLDDLHLNTILQVRSVLTPAQLAQAAATHTQMESLHDQMHNLMHQGAQSPTAQ